MGVHCSTHVRLIGGERERKKRTRESYYMTVRSSAANGVETHCNTHCNTIKHTATHCKTMQYTAHYIFAGSFVAGQTKTHCNSRCNRKNETLQHTATHCNTLQHTTTSYLQDPPWRIELKSQDTPDSTRAPTQVYTLQHTASNRNTLKHSATNRNPDIYEYIFMYLYRSVCM